MGDVTVLWLSAGLSVIGLSALLAALVVWKRRQAPEAPEPLEIFAVPPGAGPIARLDFAQSLDPILFANAAEEQALEHARVHLRDYVADATTITLQALRQWGSGSEMLVSASAEAAIALQTGAGSLSATSPAAGSCHI